MYTMYITYAAKDSDSAKAFYEAVKSAGIIDKTRTEKDNIRYDYYFSAEKENEILLLEQWVSKDAQVEHDELPHINLLMKIKKEYEIETSVEEG